MKQKKLIQSSRRNPLLRIFLISGFLLSCSNSKTADGMTPQNPCVVSSTAPAESTVSGITLLQVTPSNTNSCVTTNDSPHQVYIDPNAIKKNRLVLFLPGTGATGADSPGFLKRGAVRGYHVIGLTYPNDQAVASVCNGNGGDGDCAGNARLEILTGTELSPLFSIGLHDSIEQRTLKLLSYLGSFRPTENWSQFINSAGGIAWDKISVAGHSQGAGHAALIAKTYLVYRVSMYSGPGDWVALTSTYPNWFSSASVTPSQSYFGFIHSPDDFANVNGDPNQISGSWGSHFGMIGSFVDVTLSAAPYSGSQRLITTARASGIYTPLNRHNATMVIGNEDVWDTMTFP